MLRAFLFAGAALSLGACCAPAPCPYDDGTSILLNVTPAGQADPVEGLVVDSSAPATGKVTCEDQKTNKLADGGFAFLPSSTLCSVHGPAGTYQLTLSAPGYKTETRSVEVKPANEACSCRDFIKASLDVQMSKEP